MKVETKTMNENQKDFEPAAPVSEAEHHTAPLNTSAIAAYLDSQNSEKDKSDTSEAEDTLWESPEAPFDFSDLEASESEFVETELPLSNDPISEETETFTEVNTSNDSESDESDTEVSSEDLFISDNINQTPDSLFLEETSEDTTETPAEPAAAGNKTNAGTTIDLDSPTPPETAVLPDGGEAFSDTFVPPVSHSRKKGWLIAAGIAAFLAVVYFGGVFFFQSHFLPNSTVNGFNVSFKTADEANTILDSDLSKYVLTLNEKDGTSETITPDQIDLVYEGKSDLPKMVAAQNPFSWPLVLIPSQGAELESTFAYDEKKLDSVIGALSAVSGTGITKMANAYPKYESGTYSIASEVNGNEIDLEVFKPLIKSALTTGRTTIDLEGEKCYKQPKYTSTSDKVKTATDTLNKYLQTTVTYTFGDKTEVLDKNTTNTWFATDADLNVTIDKEKVNEYVKSLSIKHDTYGENRDFKTSYGSNVTVYGGDYGWLIDYDEETTQLMALIPNGQAVTREPVYAQTAASHGANDYGNTYVEISISGQTMWCYSGGSLVVSTPITSGTAGSYDTPGGTYALSYKATNVTLKGEGYASPVTFWMPFNGDIGIHDSSWRSDYGGAAYLTGGSHGCVNTPYSAAQAIYNAIEAGDPVIVY